MPTIESELKNNHSKLTMNPFKPLHLLLLHHGLFTLLESTTETFEASSNSSVFWFSTVTSGRLSSRYQSPASGNKHEAPSNTSVSRFHGNIRMIIFSLQLAHTTREPLTPSEAGFFLQNQQNPPQHEPSRYFDTSQLKQYRS